MNLRLCNTEFLSHRNLKPKQMPSEQSAPAKGPNATKSNQGDQEKQSRATDSAGTSLSQEAVLAGHQEFFDLRANLALWHSRRGLPLDSERLGVQVMHSNEKRIYTWSLCFHTFSDSWLQMLMSHFFTYL